MDFFTVAILRAEAAFKELELDLQLKYKAQYRCSISAGLILRVCWKCQWITAAIEEGNGKTPSWLQWEEEQTLNGIKEQRKQLHTEMASIQRWVHISRKYTCSLTKIHGGSERRCLSQEIQNSKAEDLRLKRKDGLGAAQWPQHISRIAGFIKGWDAHGEDGRGPPWTAHTPTNTHGHPAGIRDPGTWSSYQGQERLINGRVEAVKMPLFRQLKSERMLQMRWQPESGRKRQKQANILWNIFGSRGGSCGRED